MSLRWLVEIALLGTGLWGLARAFDRRPLAALTLGTFALRCLVGEGLYFLSALHAPVFRSLQLPGGFWSFGSDAVHFDAAGRQVAAQLGSEGLRAVAGHGFNEVLGALYFVFGANPSTMLVFNAACAAACVPLAWAIADHAGMPRPACLAAAALVGLWPSSFAWSGQVLKDPLEWLGSFACLAGGALLLSKRGGRTLALGGVGCLLAGGLITALLRGYALVGFGLGLVLALALFVIRNRASASRPALASAGILALLLAGGAAFTARSMGGLVGPVLSGGALQASAAAGSLAGLHLPAPRPADQAAFTAAELAVWQARPELQAFYQEHFPSLTPVQAMDVWLRSDDAQGLDLFAYAQQLTGRDFRAGSFAPVQPHGSEACPPLSRLIGARLHFDAIGGASLIDQNQAFRGCGDILADVPHALAVVFLYPLPGAWTAGGSVGGARYLSAVDAVLLWLLFPGLIAGAVNSLRRSEGVNCGITLALLLLATGMGLTVTNFGTLFRLRLEILLPGMVLAADGWQLLLAWLGQRLPAVARLPLQYPSKGFQGR